MSGTREECVFMARLAEQAERHDDMVQYMKRVACMGTELSLDERNSLSVAYKNAATARRQAWRAITLGAQQEAPDSQPAIQNYKRTVEQELDDLCKGILDILDKYLIGSASTGESKVFYMKMKGDYFRYSAEFKSGSEHGVCAGYAQTAYQAAMDEATTSLGSAHQIRLGLALNYAVFHNEVLRNSVEAIKLAKKTLEEGTADLGSLDPVSQQDSRQILQLLQDNLALWNAGGQPGQDGTEVEEM
mmetsp:Transcript_25526/g.72912  ORF Transcript_25526/g.72912 Transcript_25526/m.72912 type:complete len:245 (-) Transcript_25526:102-836(-)